MNTSGKPAPAGYMISAPGPESHIDAQTNIANHWPFAQTNLRGERESFRDPGLLPEPHRSAFCNVTWREGTQTYVVRSYDTAIAWYVPEEGWVLPDVRFSRTTDRHQAIVRRVIERASTPTGVVIDVTRGGGEDA